MNTAYKSKVLSPEDATEMHRLWPTLAAWLSYLYDHHLQAQPEALTFMEPKKIVPPGGYHSPKLVAASLYTILAENSIKLNADEFIGPIEISAQAAAYKVVNESVPIFYVAEDFIRAVAATELPSGLRIGDLQWPVPAMVLGFPLKFIHEYLGCDIGYALLAKFDGTPVKCRHIPHAPEIQSTEPKVTWAWHRKGPRGIEMFASSYMAKDNVNEAIMKYDYVDYGIDTPETFKSSEDTCNKMAALILKLLVVLNARTGFIEYGTCERPERIKKGEVRSALWAANVIGRKYRLSRPDTNGSHASPRFHLRRGHFSWQAVGGKEGFVPVSMMPRNAVGEIDWDLVSEELRAAFHRTHRRTWIEPVCIGLKDSA